MNSFPIGQCDPDELLAGATGKGVKVAVVDSGVDNQHPDLADHVKNGVVIEEVDGQLTVLPYDGCDVAGHGTACAGVIAKLAPEAEIYSVRVLVCTGAGPDGYRYAGGKPRHLIYGIDWAIENCHVINISNGLLVNQGSAYFEAFHRLVEKAYYRDRLLVAAGENREAPSYPSVFSNLIKVYWGAFENPFHFLYRLNPKRP
jgi:subtilisin family serine protease